MLLRISASFAAVRFSFLAVAEGGFVVVFDWRSLVWLVEGDRLSVG